MQARQSLNAYTKPFYPKRKDLSQEDLELPKTQTSRPSNTQVDKNNIS